MSSLSREQIRKNMQANKSSGTKAERLLAKALYAKGHRYRKNNRTVFGKPDLTFKKWRLAIFVDGEFWHGKNWATRKRQLKTNREFWIRKIERNRQRDEEVNHELRRQGWTILRFWSEDVQKHLDLCVREVEEKLLDLKMHFKVRFAVEEVEETQIQIKLISLSEHLRPLPAPAEPASPSAKQYPLSRRLDERSTGESSTPLAAEDSVSYKKQTTKGALPHPNID